MTREEAINILTYHKSNVPENSLITNALNMAVKALKQEPCEDAISRQAILDYFFRPYSNEELYSNIDIARFIKGLPFVTPKQKIGYWVFPNPATKMICTCSCCGGDGTAFGKDKFCRNCGAKMVEKDDTDDEIKVGDEVISIFGDRGYVTQNDGDELCVLYPSGAVGHSSISTYKKTGKHFSQITGVLEQMKG